MNGTTVLGLAVAGAFLVLAAPMQNAQAASLINPGAAAAVQQNAKEEMTTEVRWGWHRHHHHRWHWRRHHHHRWHWHRHHHRHW
jgi:hypothetical protein